MSPTENKEPATGAIVEETFKAKLRAFVIELSRVPFIAAVLYHPPIRNALRTVPGLRSLYDCGWNRLHPFDRIHGTDTSGHVASKDLPVTEYSPDNSYVYAGSQPAIVRAVLTTLPALETFTFIDLGCGKGRPLLVASEFPFRDIVGVDFSPHLVEIARANAAIMARRHPGRTRVRVEQGDAGAYRFPPGNLVVFSTIPLAKKSCRGWWRGWRARWPRNGSTFLSSIIIPFSGPASTPRPRSSAILQKWCPTRVRNAATGRSVTGRSSSGRPAIWRLPCPAPTRGLL